VKGKYYGEKSKKQRGMEEQDFFKSKEGTALTNPKILAPQKGGEYLKRRSIQNVDEGQIKHRLRGKRETDPGRDHSSEDIRREDGKSLPGGGVDGG